MLKIKFLPVALAALTMGLASCEKKTTTTDTNTNTAAATTEAAKTDTAQPATPATDAPKTDTTKTDATKTDTTNTDAANTDTAKPAPIPTGYTLVPELSKEPVRQFDKAPAYALQDGKDYYAVIDTNKGQIIVDLLENDTPTTVSNFVTLARNHFYDGLRFHRVIDGFMAQTGDPKSADESQKTAWGTGGPGYQFPDEVRQKLTFDQPGMLAMANSGPNTNGSQFFITFAPAPFLNGGYSLFGKVVSGQDVLTKLTRTSTGGGAETPIAGAVPDKLLSVRIVNKN